MRFSKTATAVIAMIAMIAPTAACGTDNASSDGKTEITVWAWDNNLKANAKQFMKDNPDIKVTFANAGSGKDEYVALSNAIEAGSGAPDIAQIEYYAIPEYAIKGALKDLTDNGAGKFKDFYTPGTWSSVNYAGGIYGLPMDSGPMAFFYDKEVFDKAGIDEPPATWDEFYEDAKKIRAVGSYITNDPGDAGFFNAMVWQAGGHPYSTSKDGKTVTVNLTGDPGVRKFTKLWQKMIDEDLIETKTKGTSDDWYRAVGSGEFAGVITAAWAPGMFLNQASEGAGKWRIAQMPAWSAGRTRGLRERRQLPRDPLLVQEGRRRVQVHGVRAPQQGRGHVQGRPGRLPRRPRIHEERQVPQPDHHGQHQRRDRRILRRPEIQRRVRRGRQERGHRIRIPPVRRVRSQHLHRHRGRGLHGPGHADGRRQGMAGQARRAG